MLKAFDEREEIETKNKIAQIVMLGDIIWNRMTILLSDKKDKDKIRVIREWDLAPTLFETERAMNEQREKEFAIQEQVKKRRRFVKATNEARKKGVSRAAP